MKINTYSYWVTSPSDREGRVYTFASREVRDTTLTDHLKWLAKVDGVELSDDEVWEEQLGIEVIFDDCVMELPILTEAVDLIRRSQAKMLSDLKGNTPESQLERDIHVFLNKVSK